MTELHTEILSHESQVTNGVTPQPIPGIIVTESDVLEPPPVRQGGLQRLDSVGSIFPTSCGLSLSNFLQQHTFKRPARPIEPPTPRTSILGLDKLALEKRTQAQENGNGNGRKRFRIERDDDPVFKGECHFKFVLVSC